MYLLLRPFCECVSFCFVYPVIFLPIVTYSDLRFEDTAHSISLDFDDFSTENLELLMAAVANEEKVVDETENDGSANERKDVKVLFLDVDGVLNQNALEHKILEDLELDQESGLSILHLKRLKNIIDKTDCYIVLSSSWRLFKASKAQLFNAFKLDGIDIDISNRYLGDTPKLDFTIDRCRVMEIKQWLEQSKKCYNIIEWVVVDDLELDETEDCKFYLDGHFVMTDGEKAMSEQDMNKVISIFNAK